MPDEVFFYYHLPLIAAILLWYAQPTTTLLGMVFFSAPFMFTMWGAMAVFAKGKLPAVMV